MRTFSIILFTANVGLSILNAIKYGELGWVSASLGWTICLILAPNPKP